MHYKGVHLKVSRCIFTVYPKVICSFFYLHCVQNNFLLRLAIKNQSGKQTSAFVAPLLLALPLLLTLHTLAELLDALDESHQLRVIYSTNDLYRILSDFFHRFNKPSVLVSNSIILSNFSILTDCTQINARTSLLCNCQQLHIAVV